MMPAYYKKGSTEGRKQVNVTYLFTSSSAAFESWFCFRHVDTHPLHVRWLGQQLQDPAVRGTARIQASACRAGLSRMWHR